MRCSECGSDNRDGRKFCAACGAPLAASCTRCGASNLPGERFCGECGASLNAPTSAPGPETPPVETRLVAERRHLTVLLCDLVGSTALAAQLDPEEWREAVAGYQRMAAAAITRFAGYVARYVGDGVLAFFGYPEAHDNDAERAVRAGLALLDALDQLNQQAGHAKLSARIGIDSGAVVVGGGTGQETDVFGDAPNIAARVQASAAPGTVAISEATQRLVAGLFVVEELGAQTLKGVERPVQLYRVVRPSGMRGRFEAAAAAGRLTPFVGREDELRSLMSRWERVREGEGQVVTIIGEAGIGKSRLVRRFHEQIADSPYTWVEAAAGPFFQNTPFHAVAEMLRELLAWEERFAQLETRLEGAGMKPAEAIPLLAPLLGQAIPANYSPSALPPEQQRRRLLATLVEWVLGSVRAQPLVIVTEDLHWGDPSTLELIQLLVEQGATAPLLLLYTARPEFHPPWPPRAHHTQIMLGRLNTRDVRTMVGEVAARRALSNETVATVVERTSGVPLFVEELTRAVLESGDAKLTGHAIPVTLHDSLMARLDRLGPAKEVIQIGAVIGSDFSYELLHAVHPIPKEGLQAALRSLTDAELLYVRGLAPDATYQFKHALIRDAAYEALLKSRRKDIHRLVGRAIDERFPTLKEEHPEILAHHWMKAGETGCAMAEWSRAGSLAEGRNAFKEALESYKLALALLRLLPKSPERDSRELELSQAVVLMLIITSGFSAPETVEATAQAAALAETSGSLGQLVDLSVSRGYVALASGDLSVAVALADQALDLANRTGNRATCGSVYSLEIQARYWRGDLSGVEKHFAASLEFFSSVGVRQLRGGAAPAFGPASWNAWSLGRADVARQRIVQMMATVNESNMYDVAYSALAAAHLRVHLGEYEQAGALAARALALSEKHQFSLMVAISRCLLGHTHASLGRASEGIELIRRAMSGWLELRSRLGLSNYTAYLAAALEREGAIADALETIEQALRANPDELVSRPEIFRLRAGLYLKRGQTELAEADLFDAIVLAHRMGAKALELRATTSLARLMAKQGRRDDARTTLAEIYNWFTEGFDTADLRDAKALLDELAT